MNCVCWLFCVLDLLSLHFVLALVMMTVLNIVFLVIPLSGLAFGVLCRIYTYIFPILVLFLMLPRRILDLRKSN